MRGREKVMRILVEELDRLRDEQKALDSAITYVEQALQTVDRRTSRVVKLCPRTQPVATRAVARQIRHWSPEARALASIRLRQRWRSLKSRGGRLLSDE